MTLFHAAGEGPPPEAPKRRWLLILLYVVAVITVARALWLVPRQVAELSKYGYFTPYHRLPTAGEARLHGRVVEAWVGEPVAEVEMEFVRLPAGEPRSDPEVGWDRSRSFKVRSEMDGRFDVGVAPGVYLVSVASEFHHAAPLTRTFVGSAAQIPLEEIVVVHPLCDLTLKLVDDEGHPIRDAEVFVRGGDPGRAFYSRRPAGMMTTDSRGAVHWRSWCGPATVRYVAIPGRPPAFVERQVRLEPEPAEVTITLGEIEASPENPTDPSTVVVEWSEDALTLDLPQAPPRPAPEDWESWGSVDAVVVDPQGGPADAIVLFEKVDHADSRYPYSERYITLPGFTQDAGRVRVEHVEPGRFRVVLITPDWPVQTLQIFTHDLGRDTDLGDLVVRPVAAGAAHGRVMGPGGPVGGAEVYLVATGEMGRLFLTAAEPKWTPRTVSAPDGSFRLGPLPVDDVVLAAYHADVGVSRPTIATTRGDLRIDLHLEPATTDRRTGEVEGCLLDLDSYGVYVAQIIDPSRARDLGLLPGDRLLYIDDIDVRWMEKSRVFALLSGEERGVPFTVTVQRPGEEDSRVLEWGEG